VRAYREKQLQNSGLQPMFPVWGLPTRELASTMIKSGVRAKLTCVDPKLLAPEFVGREFDEQLLLELPRDVDPCGENGEFHTFVYAGPMFRQNLQVEVGEIVSRDGFVFADLTLSSPADVG
jgi:diphthamide synthase (EF-2-diphthine--ammonia ligase)